MNVLMPQLGETVAEGKITKWFKSAGQAVAPGDNLFEIETDKVSMEVPATSAGVLAEIRVPAGEVAPVGAIVAVIADGAGQPGEMPAQPARNSVTSVRTEPAAASSPRIPAKAGIQDLGPRFGGNERKAQPLDPFFEVRTPERNYGPARLSGGVTVTPLARRLAAENGIDLAQLRGSGPHGRIVARDIEQAPRPEQRRTPEAPSADRIKALYAPEAYEEVPLDAMRRTIAARLTEAQTVPHFYLTADVDIGRLIALREEANAGATGPLPNLPPQAGEGTAALKLSLNDFLIRAWALALHRVPAANAVWAGDRLLRLKHSDIGVAIALDDGLVAPVLRQADTKSVSAISAEMKDLSARARGKKLTAADLQGGSSAISNLGMYGVREFAAIINPPHATILAVGAARRQAVERPDGGVAFASLLSVTVSCDHRVVDGALGAQLLAAFKALIEAPVRMLV
ncbi:MAG TPA: dihydrolipoamide acetyltransferase family protein [Xanthobacteraceae bacterium]|nr:dihydrolipoamide acetyltransferase family protein [Xanthobacteraceae bacterium]